MVRLEDLTRGASVKGVVDDGIATVVDVKWIGSAAVVLTYKDAVDRPNDVMLYREDEPRLELVTLGRPWSFDGDGALFRLASEAYRINLAYLFDPLLAVHTSDVTPLPHQITAVYESMLPRQPLRYLLADDPGAGKTIMTGLFLKELLMRGDLRRCLICCPGNLCEQWQDELFRKFNLDFEIISRESMENARSGNVFSEQNLVICRLDQLSRNEDVQDRLKQTDWDVVVCDEAHKMSASFYGNELKATKRYRLGQLLGSITRHFLLLTATPHNGKEEDFQLFMALLDADRFEGRFRDGVHTVDTSDLMRRMVKEQLLKFDGTPLFPERRAYTVNYQLSDPEARLYQGVTEYVREEMNRADRLTKEGEGKRGNMVGFALTVLQRRLASSPEAIYQSLRRRRERLERRLEQERLLKRGLDSSVSIEDIFDLPSDESIDEFYDEAPDVEVEEKEEAVVDSASAARTIAELEHEIVTLCDLEKTAAEVRRSGIDRKWEELSSLLQGDSRSGSGVQASELFDASGHRRKLIVFTEHRDTLSYLAAKIRTLVGRPESVVTICGGMGREERRKTQEAFIQDKDVLILVATDAAGEGINLQRAHLMVNYDLPWNPNRIEQRFGRIHRIGQREVCHLWNLVAFETREGEVYARLLRKLEQQSESLGGSVFDVLGKSFTERRLRDLLIDAIRYGDDPEVKARLDKAVDSALDTEHIQALIDERALTHEIMDAARVGEIRDEMRRAEARRLQPHFIASFFREAFRTLGGTMREREPNRYEITHVPTAMRIRDRQIGIGETLLRRYERITFERELISVPSKPLASFVCSGHPLLDSTIDLVLERHRDLLKRGAVLIDPDNEKGHTRTLFYIENAVQDARRDLRGDRRVISRQMQFVEIDCEGEITSPGYAPYLDYRPATEEERSLLTEHLEGEWLSQDLHSKAITYAVEKLVPNHLSDVRSHKEHLVQKTMEAVKERLTKEICYWDLRATQLKAQEEAGKQQRLNSQKARERTDELQGRLQRRLAELEQERHLSSLPPTVTGGAIVVPQSVLNQLQGAVGAEEEVTQADRERIDRAAIAAVVAFERSLGRNPKVMPHDNPGYDIESFDPASQQLKFIEVKGKAVGSTSVTISKTQILTALNKPDDFILAVVEVDGENAAEPRYIYRPFQSEPDFAATSVNFSISALLGGVGE